MKCDELKPLVFSLNDLAYIDESAVKKNFENPHDHAVYKATEVDAAIAELKKKLHDAEMRADLAEAAETERKIDYDKLNAENRRLKRALWLERAKHAQEKAWNFHEKNLVEKCAKWDNVHLMCRAKAEEYK